MYLSCDPQGTLFRASSVGQLLRAAYSQVHGYMWAALPSAGRPRSAVLAYAQVRRHPQNRKYITYRDAASAGLTHGRSKYAQIILVKIGRVVPEICSQTDRHTHTRTDTAIAMLRSVGRSAMGSGVKMEYVHVQPVEHSSAHTPV